MLFTANNLPQAIRDLPGLAVAPFMEAANAAHSAGLPEAEAERVGMAMARRAVEMAAIDVARADGETRQQRFDCVGLRLDASSVVKLDNGMVDVWGVATRSGAFDYGGFWEYRPPDEVFNPDSLASLVGVAFTILHPDDPVTTANARDLTHGWVLHVEQRGSEVWVRVRIATDEALAAIQRDGLIELSCGYSARLELVEGVSPEGEPYNAIQRDIRYNHLALVEMARAGHMARLRFDGARVQRDHQTKGTDPMQKFKFRYDGKTYEAPLFLLPGLRESAIKTDGVGHRNGANRKDLATGRITIEMEGDEPTELVLPLPMVEEMLSMVGAPPSEAAAAAEGAAEEGAAAGAAEAAAAEMDEGAAGGAPGAPAAPAGTLPEEDGKRMDAATVERMIETRLAAERVRMDVATRHRAGVERSASRVLDSGYRWDSADTVQIQADTVGHVMSDRKDEAGELAKAARKGDERSAGKLDALFTIACEQHRVDQQDQADAASFREDDASESGGEGGTVSRIDSARAKHLKNLNRGMQRDADRNKAGA